MQQVKSMRVSGKCLLLINHGLADNEHAQIIKIEGQEKSLFQDKNARETLIISNF